MDSLAQTNSCNLAQLFCFIDDFVRLIYPTTCRKGRPRELSLSETATIALLKSAYGIPQLKQMYRLLSDRFASEFHLPCYKNFVCVMNDYAPELLFMINLLLLMRNKNAGVIKIVDSTAVPVCKNMRISSHKVMKDLATRYKTTTGYFYGLKLHVVTDEYGNLLKFCFTTANVDDRKILDHFLNLLSDSLVLADAGYVSKTLEKKALHNNNFLLTCVRNNMKKLSTPLHIFLLNKRIHVEQFFSVLKDRFGLVTSLPRSVKGYLAHYIRAIFGCLFMPAFS